MGRIGIQCLMHVASIYKTMENGTVPSPTEIWASSKLNYQLSSLTNTLFPFALVLSLNPKCLRPAMRSSETISINIFDIRAYAWQKCCPDVHPLPPTCQWLQCLHSQLLSSGARACRGRPHSRWSLHSEGPSGSDMSVLLRSHRPYEHGPAECARSVRRRWLHPHPLAAMVSLQPLRRPASSWPETPVAAALECLAVAVQYLMYMIIGWWYQVLYINIKNIIWILWYHPWHHK